MMTQHSIVRRVGPAAPTVGSFQSLSPAARRAVLTYTMAQRAPIRPVHVGMRPAAPMVIGGPGGTVGFDLFKDVFAPIGRFVEGAVIKPVGQLASGILSTVGDLTGGLPLIGDLVKPVINIVKDVVDDPLGSIGGVLSNVPIAGDIVMGLLDTVGEMTGIEEGYFGSKAKAPLPPDFREPGAVSVPADYSSLAPGVLTPRDVPQIPGDATVEQARQFVQTLLAQTPSSAGVVTITYNPQAQYTPPGSVGVIDIARGLVTDVTDIARGLITPPPRQRPQGQPGPCTIPPGAHGIVPCSWGAVARGDQVQVPPGTLLVTFEGAQFTGSAGLQNQSGGTPFNFGSAIVLPVFPFMDTLVAARNGLFYLAQKDCALGADPLTSPLVQQWNALANQFAQYVQGTPFQAMLDGLRQQMSTQLRAAAQAACQRAQQAQRPAQTAPSAQQATQQSCPSGEVFRHRVAGIMRSACIPPETAEYCRGIGGTITAQVRADGELRPYCRPPMRKEDLVTQIAPGVLMVQPRINPLGVRPIVRRVGGGPALSAPSPIRALPGPAVSSPRPGPVGGQVFGNTSMTALRPY